MTGPPTISGVHLLNKHRKCYRLIATIIRLQTNGVMTQACYGGFRHTGKSESGEVSGKEDRPTDGPQQGWDMPHGSSLTASGIQHREQKWTTLLCQCVGQLPGVMGQT